MLRTSSVVGDTAAPPAESVKRGGSGGTRDIMAMLTNRVLNMVLEELSHDQTRSHLKEHVVVPVIRMFMVECMPYAAVFTAIMFVILLMSGMTLMLSILFYFRAVSAKRGA